MAAVEAAEAVFFFFLSNINRNVQSDKPCSKLQGPACKCEKSLRLERKAHL